MAIGKAIVFENRDKYKTPKKTTANANEEINNFTNALPVAIEKIEILKRKLALNLPKDELENYNVCPSLLEQRFLVHFLEEFKTPKKTFRN